MPNAEVALYKKYNSYLPKLGKWQTKSSPDRYDSGMYVGEWNCKKSGGEKNIRQIRCGIWLNRWQTYQSNHYGGYLFFLLFLRVLCLYATLGL